MTGVTPYGVVNFCDPSSPTTFGVCANEVPMKWLRLIGDDYFCWWPKNHHRITKLVKNLDLEEPNKDK